jgi:hypothetical protein
METFDDEALLERLRAIVADVDPVPELVLDTARAAFALRRLDAELAELVRDSYDSPVGAYAVRAAGLTEVRMLSFEVGPLSVELQVTQRSGTLHLVAHVVGVELAGAWLETDTSVRELETDDGLLMVEGLQAGRIRFRLSTVDGHSYHTSWVLI